MRSLFLFTFTFLFVGGVEATAAESFSITRERAIIKALNTKNDVYLNQAQNWLNRIEEARAQGASAQVLQSYERSYADRMQAYFKSAGPSSVTAYQREMARSTNADFIARERAILERVPRNVEPIRRQQALNWLKKNEEANNDPAASTVRIESERAGYNRAITRLKSDLAADPQNANILENSATVVDAKAEVARERALMNSLEGQGTDFRRTHAENWLKEYESAVESGDPERIRRERDKYQEYRGKYLETLPPESAKAWNERSKLATADLIEADQRATEAKLQAAETRLEKANEALLKAGTTDERVAAREEIKNARQARDALRPKADDAAQNNGEIKKASPGSEVSATADPCAATKLSFRQAEECSMRKYNEAVKEADQAVARCFYSGFAAKNGDKCEPVRSTEDAKKLGSEIKGVEKTDCGSGMVMCNPLVFGIQSDKKAICVRGTKDASKECAVKANLKSKEAQDRYKELMKDKGNQAKLAELKKKHKRSCDNSAMVKTGAGDISQTQLDGAFTANVRNRRNEKSKEDHERTCKVLGDAIAYAEGVTRTNEEPAKAVVAEPAVDGTGTR